MKAFWKYIGSAMFFYGAWKTGSNQIFKQEILWTIPLNYAIFLLSLAGGLRLVISGIKIQLEEKE
jgi:hypothetical protein